MERKTRKQRKRKREGINKSRWEGTKKGRRKKENTKRVKKRKKMPPKVIITLARA